MGATNNPSNSTNSTFNLGDKIKSLVEPALTYLGTKIPGFGWVVGAFESIKEWFQASSDYEKANDPKIGAEAQKEYKVAGMLTASSPARRSLAPCWHRPDSNKRHGESIWPA